MEGLSVSEFGCHVHGSGRVDHPVRPGHPPEGNMMPRVRNEQGEFAPTLFSDENPEPQRIQE